MTKGRATSKKKQSKKSSSKIKSSTKKKEKLFDFNGILLIVVAALVSLSLLSGFFTDSSTIAGSLGGILNRFFIGIFGIGAYVLPFLLVFMGVCYIKTDKYFKATKRTVGILLFIIVTMLFMEMIVLGAYYQRGEFVKAIAAQWGIIWPPHGGLLSLMVVVPMYLLIGRWGSYIIFIALYIVSLVLINGITLKELFTFERPKKEKKKLEDEKGNNTESLNYVLAADEEDEVEIAPHIQPEDIKIIDFMKDSDEENEKKGFVENKKEEIKRSENKKSIDEDIEINLSQSPVIYEYKYPTLDLLNKSSNNFKNGDKKELLNNANKLQDTLASFGVEAKVVQVTKGPSVTRFELQPHVGVKVSKIVNLADDIALNLAASGVRIEAPIPGKAAVGIEVPNKDLSAVLLREVIESDEFTNSKKNLAFALGKDIAGNCVVGDLTKMPHMLIAGATGSGKSVCINTLLISLIYKYTPQEVKLLLIDPKVVELNIYNGIPHLLIPVVTDPKKAAGALYWAVNEMTRRYKLFADNNVRNIEGYNEFAEKGIVDEKLPWVVIIIDELADLMMVCPNDVEEYIARLAQMARAAGMHLVIATQRPSVDVITGVIKANIPSRVSFAVSSQIDSRTILDSSGAEKLLGKGDMLYYPVGESKPIRIQGAFVSEEEVEAVVSFIRESVKEVEYKKEIIDEIENSASKGKNSEDCDELLDEAIQIVLEEGQASTSMLQRRLKIGYNRAARIIDEMEAEGIISGRNGSKPRQVLGREDLSR